LIKLQDVGRFGAATLPPISRSRISRN